MAFVLNITMHAKFYLHIKYSQTSLLIKANYLPDVIHSSEVNDEHLRKKDLTSSPAKIFRETISHLFLHLQF